MTTERWFHAHVTAQQAEELLLKEGQDGSFLVRPSQTNPGDFKFSVRRLDEVVHIEIQNSGNYHDLYRRETVTTLGELVRYYLENPGTLREKNGRVIELNFPLNCEERVIELNFPLNYEEVATTERWYHSCITRGEAETLLLTKGQHGSFLVYPAVDHPGYYVLCVRVDNQVLRILICRKEDGVFDVGGGPKFDSLTQLIEHYNRNPVVEASGSVLKHPLRSTSFLPTSISQRISELQKQNPDVYGRTGFWEEFEQLQQREVNHLYSRKEGARPENLKSKNRFKNILPYDHTRVILKDSDPTVVGSDYFHGSYISGEVPGSETRYIATQGCLPATVLDFWKMIWQENTRVIVMTTNEVVRGRNKCTCYWPDVVDNKAYGKVHVANLKETVNPHYILREFLVFHEEEDAGKTIYHYHFKAWPDHGVPDDPGTVLGFLQDVNQCQNTLTTDGVEPGPIVVHCSAGIGHTGVFIVTDILLHLINYRGQRNVYVCVCVFNVLEI